MLINLEPEKSFSLGSNQFAVERILPDFGADGEGRPGHEKMIISVDGPKNIILFEPEYEIKNFGYECGSTFDNAAVNLMQSSEDEMDAGLLVLCRQEPMLKNINLNIISGETKETKPKKFFKCDICKSKAKSQKDLNKHFGEHLKKSGDKLECLSCGEFLSNHDNFAEHAKGHKKKRFACELCGKTFRFNCLLKDHKNLHFGHRPYLCSNCGKTFSLRASLKQHARTHGAVKKYKCIYCDFRVFVKADLTKHIRTHTGERPYVCDICGESYIQSSHLLVHKRSHSGERPYKCDLCNRGFTKKGDVARHRRIHTGELPYLCSVCGKAFRQSTQCSNHVKHHHPGTSGGKITIPGYASN